MAQHYGEHTRAVRAAAAAPAPGTPMRIPVYRASTYAFATSRDYAASLTGDGQYAYARIDSPNSDAFAAAVAALEGAHLEGEVHGQGFASGMAAISTTLLALTHAGAHVVASRALYGNTYKLLDVVLRRFGVAVDFVDITDPAAVRAAFRPATVLVYTETLANRGVPSPGARRRHRAAFGHQIPWRALGRDRGSGGGPPRPAGPYP